MVSRKHACLSFSTHDIAFVFPHEEAPGNVLWANRQQLGAASDYWARELDARSLEECGKMELLSSWQDNLRKDLDNAMNEVDTKKRGGARTRNTNGQPARKRSKVKAEEPSSSQRASTAPDAQESDDSLQVADTISYILIQEEPIATYRVVLTWLETGVPDFGRLLPDVGVANPTAPDAIYALADKVALDELKAAALANYTAQLNQLDADAILEHLLGNRACDFAELKEAAMEAALRHIETIKKGTALGLLEQRLNQADDRRVRTHLSSILTGFLRAPERNRQSSGGTSASQLKAEPVTPPQRGGQQTGGILKY